MLKQEINALIKENNLLENISKDIENNKFPLRINNLYNSFFSFFLEHIINNNIKNKEILIIVPNGDRLNELYIDLESLNLKPMIFMNLEQPYDLFNNAHKRSELINKIKENRLNNDYSIVLTEISSVIQPIKLDEIIQDSFILECNKEYDLKEIEDILNFNYLKVDKVYQTKEYSLNGQILDIFKDDKAYRLHFDFDKLIKINEFDFLTQETLKEKSHDFLKIFKDKTYNYWDENNIMSLEKALIEAREIDFYFKKDLLEKVRENKKIFHFQSYYSMALKRDSSNSIIEFFKDSLVILDRYNDYNVILHNNNNFYEEIYNENKDKNFPLPSRILFEFDNLVTKLNYALYHFTDIEKTSIKGLKQNKEYYSNFKNLNLDIKNYLKNDYKVLIALNKKDEIIKVKENLDIDIDIELFHISKGFLLNNTVILTYKDIFKDAKDIINDEQIKKIDDFSTLVIDDYVVHKDYGIGVFKGVKEEYNVDLKLIQNYIMIEFKNQEFVYVPFLEIAKIEKYVGRKKPKLNNISSNFWKKTLKEVEEKADNFSSKLLKIYSERQQTKGFMFLSDTDDQIKFESEFEYEETEDQLQVIKEVKNDMESSAPMDRLICGDVGFGKTEIAFRAAFKALCNNKQVVFIAPTTVLSKQHYDNASARMKNYTFNIAYLSAKVSNIEKKEIIKNLKEGKIDFVIGTHSLLSKDISFKDLGLLIIDEEQKFGVAHKERAKEIKISLDCLMLSATPIPRTLYMSLIQLKQISKLETSPQDRLPIKVHFDEHDEEIIKEAILKEVKREGQVFYLHNNIKNLDSLKSKLNLALPDVNFKIAHGQMDTKILNKTMQEFHNKEFDVLISTTIIESGIDIPNANTIIITQSDRFGLSQLYQIKGRVGRSSKQAYAYLFYDEGTFPSEPAMQRLESIIQNTALGSGYLIAKTDMELRGVGNLVGKEQSGEMFKIGFNMYLKILRKALDDKMNLQKDEIEDIIFNIDYANYSLPLTYLKNIEKQMEISRQIVFASSEKELDKIKDDLIDKFLDMPKEVKRFFDIIKLKLHAKQLYISKIEENRFKKHITIEFFKMNKINIDSFNRVLNNNKERIRLNNESPNIIILDTKKLDNEEKFAFLFNTLKKIDTKIVKL